ncbi:hypothetical protein A2865_03385 [Candidatus Woesebacteria bacterium RIFCSPHIGHO2_01_FULL_39_17]|uniref:Protein containing Lytic transglycosylase-like, catalytic-like protein n=3 Tax=Candidatus Woeseibacteriota TaxID=1752722 RepID=A0A0G0RHT7_9BACT|nr:MAG: Protein containing Lytic transglycosylase-like, catalytic-like protein [Microgenomates group bacterium GW2011_GWC1_38_12]KKQ93803.1 MAG: Protein containing Lytic transglycosylase-like, catalytic-like protein [Candidatus Woesebacteria bacterium GW2011_GWB1_39_10b]KKR13222.1 MAG: Protein containing Lytic transglycosylase-like, catalytic-like protein [Candidatus Woesebacteria bacterium GW2011_GWA1_39_21b]OGM23577.1 MAG: hypothetical protein A2865_03385 [Candidatus Woesebacteria bacterium RI
MYKLGIPIFFVGIILGYNSLRLFNEKLALKEEVLSQESEQVFVSPTDFPTPSPSPSPTPVLPPTLTPTLTPIPRPSPLPALIVPADLMPLFAEFSSTYNVDKEELERIAYCESHFNRGVWAPPYAGMYQFHENTWEKYRNMMGKDPNIDLRFGARESIETAAFVLSIGQQHIWPSCSK